MNDEQVKELVDQLAEASYQAFWDIAYDTPLFTEDKIEYTRRANKYSEALYKDIETFIYGLVEELKESEKHD